MLASVTVPAGVDSGAGGAAVILRPPPPACARAGACALGLLVPGAGPTVTRRGALASLLRGKVLQATLGGVPGGRPLITIARAPARVTFYVTLPPPGRHHNVRRYPLAVVGPGWSGILVSDRTRVPGLVSVADIAPAAKAIAAGARPDLHARADPHPVATLRSLDTRLTAAHDARGWATIALVATTLALAGAALATGLPALGRAAVLAPLTLLVTSLVLSALHAADTWLVTLALMLVGGASAVGAGLSRRAAPWLALALVAAVLVVLAAWPDVNSLATIGPHPDGGGRYYGITNEVETLLVAPLLFAGAVLGWLWLVPVALLGLVTLGWSRAGADGGGVLVLLVGMGVLALRLSGERLGARRLALVGAGTLAAALAFVAVDAATGGSSHVTRAVGGGPGSLLGDLGHRLHVSWAGATRSWAPAFAVVSCAAVLVWLGTRRPRQATVDAFLAALFVSLLVNDTPTDVLGFGALSGASLAAWERVREHAPRGGP